MPCGIESLFTEELWLQSYGCSVYKSNEKGHNVIQLLFFLKRKADLSHLKIKTVL